MDAPTPRRLTVLGLTAPLFLGLLAANASADGDVGSLEKLLEEARRRQAEALSRLEAPVAELVKALDETPADETKDVERIQGQLLALGKEAAPLLVGHLDPGVSAGGAERRLAQRVAEVMERLPSSAVTEDLIAITREGSKNGRRNAMRVLGTSPDRERAGTCLRDLFRNATGTLRTQAVTSLARLGGPENEAVLLEAMTDPDPEVLRAVLIAMTEVASPAGRVGARKIAGAPKAAATLVPELLDYFRSIAAEVQDEDVEELVRLAGHGAVPEGDRIRILETVPKFSPNLGSRLRKLFDPLVNHADDDLSEAAQICIAILGDRNARRDLVRRGGRLRREELLVGQRLQAPGRSVPQAGGLRRRGARLPARPKTRGAQLGPGRHLHRHRPRGVPGRQPEEGPRGPGGRLPQPLPAAGPGPGRGLPGTGRARALRQGPRHLESRNAGGDGPP